MYSRLLKSASQHLNVNMAWMYILNGVRLVLIFLKFITSKL